MHSLNFNNPVFHEGLNVSVRRGLKWYYRLELTTPRHPVRLTTGRYTPIRGKEIGHLEARVFRCCDIPLELLSMEHDPACRTRRGLQRGMEEAYPGFDRREIVTVVIFEVRNFA